MKRHAFCVLGMGVLLCTPAGAQTLEQPLQLAQREPAFYAIVGDRTEPADVRSFAVLRSRLVLRLHNATIPEALTAIQEQTSLRFAYKPSIFPAGATVSLDARDITVAAALTQILLDAEVDVELAPYGLASLVARKRPVVAQQVIDSIVVRGTITDSSTHAPVAGAVVRVVGRNQGALSGRDGTYAITGLASGSYRLAVRRLGYAVATVDVTTTQAGVYTRNIALVVVPTVLDQVVTTVTGNQRLSTIGNTISTINVDSLTPTTPVTTLSDVINARASGVQVINTGGLTGASPSTYIRGAGSLLLSTEPLLYIDGVRVANSTATGFDVGTASGRFNDLVPDEIESIEIVKGPSAATLYGTDAANGVILVTTKRGLAGPPRWNIYTEGGALTINRDQFPYNYTGWGHPVGGGAETNSCTLLTVASDGCVQDSVTKFTPMRVPALSPLGVGNRAEGGAQVSGGEHSLRYFIAGDYTSEVGYLKNPPSDQHLLDSLLGPTAGSGDVRHPNAVSKYDGRLNVTTPIGSTGDVSLSTSYLSQTSHIPNGGVIYNAYGGEGYNDPYNGWLFGDRPANFFSTLLSEGNQHFTGAVTAHWMPFSWLTGRVTTGVDASNEAYTELTPTAVGQFTNTVPGSANDTRGTTTIYSTDLGLTGRLPLASSLVSSTSIGAQYHRSSVAIATATATQLPIGGTSINAGIPSGSEVDSQSVVAGVYAEEQLALHDRLFLTGAVRVDGANDFGQHFQSAAYPKGSISWLVSKERFFPTWSWLNLIRLRAAYGESGTQPGEVLTTLKATPATIDGVVQPGNTLATIGNSSIQPERQKEFEAGTDVDLGQNRVHLEFTYYTKRNVNALYDVPLGASLGSVGFIEENVGEIANWGYEALASVTPVETRALTWDVAANGSINHNQVIRLGRYFQPFYGTTGSPSIVAGYPIYSMFAQPYTYNDANHDGIIEPNEVIMSSAERYYGPTIPPMQLTVGTHVGLLDSRIRIGALFDYRGGFVIPNEVLGDQCLLNTAQATVSKAASAAAQATCVAYSGAVNGVNDNRGLISDAAFIRFRELSLTYTAPDGLARQLKARSLSITLSARNLALLTHFSGGDPETPPASPGNAANGVFSTGGGMPPAQYWLARINIGL